MSIIYNREQGNKAIKNMQKTSEKQRIGLDKTVNIVYNTSMLNEKKLTRRNEMSERMIETIKVTLIIGSGIIGIITCAIGCSWLLLSTL
jgi:CHASE3 domain sensor protein